MSRQSIILASLAAAGALMVSGCSAGGGTTPAAIPDATAPAASATTTTDAMTCAGFGDALTIIDNADAGLSDGRMAAEEQQGWYRLATRVLDGVPTRGAGSVSDAIAALKNTAPAVALGSMGETGIGSAEWDSGRDTLSIACTDAGTEMAVERFTGG